MRYQQQTSESQFMDDLGDFLTKGNYSIVKWISILFIYANSMLLMIILNKNMGSQIAKRSESIIAIVWLIILFHISLYGWEQNIQAGMEDTTFSGGLIVIHGFAFLFFSRWRRLGAWWNMRNSGKPGVGQRLEYGIGDSVLYPVIRWILRPLKMMDEEKNPKTWLKLNEDRWMEIWQPIILFLVSLYIHTIGYEVYGMFLAFATGSYFYITHQAFNNRARMAQKQVDANLNRDMMRPYQEDEIPHVIGGNGKKRQYR